MNSVSLLSRSTSSGMAVVDALLIAVTRDGFTLRYCDGTREPTLIVGTYDWGDWTDIVVIRGIDEVITARLPITDDTDVFEPEVMVWAYQGAAQYALRALLELPHPDHPDAPRTAVPAPQSLHVPAARNSPITIRPPSAAVARARQRRLAAVVPAARTATHDEETKPPQ